MATRTTVNASALPFVADRDSLLHDGGGTINWASVPDTYRATPRVTQTVTTTAIAAADATAVAVTALGYAIPSGTVLQFGADKYATLTAAAAASAVSLTVEALTTALASGDVATHVVEAGSGDKFIPAGTPMDDGANGNTAMVPANSSSARVLLATNAQENSRTDALTGYGKIRGGVIYQNLLPVTLVTDAKTALTRFSFISYGDNTAS